MLRSLASLLLIGLLTLAPQNAQANTEVIEIQSGDRVVFLGGTLIEREQRYSEWEADLTTMHANKDVTFRNLGWSGDTVWAESRGIFDPPGVGYRRMIEQIHELQPTIVIICYGNTEALAGEDKLPAFLKQYAKLLDDIQAVTQTKTSFVLLSPILQCPVIAPQTVVDFNNRLIAYYAKGIQKMADERQIPFISQLDLLAKYQDVDGTNRATDDGIIPNQEGYRLSAQTVWGASDDAVQNEKLREAIVRKNQYYFQQWRPQNITYLTGFRKHEQGQNAAELAEFNALIATQEKRINELKSQD